MNIFCLILYFQIFTFFALFPLHHICYYFSNPTPYCWTLTLYIVYIFTIHLVFLGPINRDYSRLLFDNITYSDNNMGRHCAFVIYQHKGECNSLIIILLLFCLSRWVPLCLNVVYCIHIYNTFVALMTDKPRLFKVVVLLHHILIQQYGRTLRLFHLLTQRWVKFIGNYTTAILFIALSTAVP